MYLFLDDLRKPKDVTWIDLPQNVEWHIVRNYRQFVEHIQKYGTPKFVSFDMDLAPEHYEISNTFSFLITTFKEETGIDCYFYLYNYCKSNNINFPKFEIHSLNGIAKDFVLMQHKINFNLPPK